MVNSVSLFLTARLIMVYYDLHSYELVQLLELITRTVELLSVFDLTSLTY